MKRDLWTYLTAKYDIAETANAPNISPIRKPPKNGMNQIYNQLQNMHLNEQHEQNKQNEEHYQLHLH